MSTLRTSEGELLDLSVSVPLRQLQGLLNALNDLPFPVNPEIVHSHSHAVKVANQVGSLAIDVRFPAYERRIPGVIQSLEKAGFRRDLLTVRAALSA